jgi:hypothetical protein
MRTFLAALIVLPYDQHVATRWGEIHAYAQLRGRARPVNDSWIAACCLVRDLPLATLNIKDYADYAEHEGPRTRPLRTPGVECLVERTTAHRRSPETQDANRKPR